MDGLRARRQKSGSPLGRIIDEALDMTQQACYSLWLGYIFRFDSRLIEFMLLMVNIVFYSMEMKFIMLKNLKLVIGEIGPVEIEILLASGLFAAYYFGSEGLQKTLGESYGVENEWFASI
jgi:phosphatidylglycerophosphate synthase